MGRSRRSPPHDAHPQAIVVRRYDRTTLSDGRTVRIHQEDFCQALSAHPTRKYQNEGGPGPGDMVELLRREVADTPDAQVERLCHALAYNWLVLGTDAHAKNYSLLLSGRQVRLAPLYDIASAAPYDIHPRKVRLAHKIGGEYRPTILTSKHWDRLATEARIDPGALHDAISTMATALPDALADAISEADLRAGEVATASRIRESITAWTRQCATQLTAGVGAQRDRRPRA